MSFALRMAAGLSAVVAAGLLFTFERPPVINVQRGYRGTGMQEVYNPRLLAQAADRNAIPPYLPQLQFGPMAGTVYKNVQVLKNVHTAEFTRLMASMTAWVAPQQGCAYCHSLNNMASDSLYTKVVARRMLQMVQHINSDWPNHVGTTGVTCYTCHRGQPVPAYIWYKNDGPPHAGGFAETGIGKNSAIGPDHSSLPYDPYTAFLEHDDNIRVQGTTALPEGNRQSIKQTEWTYALMLHFSQSLGVNCSYCHNTRSFGDWSQSSPQRVTAWYGIRMARDLNNNYLDELHDVFPPVRLGADGDAPKVNCMTCHQGAFKPLYGVSMAKDFPELHAAAVIAAAAVVPAAPQSPSTVTPAAAPGSPPGDIPAPVGAAPVGAAPVGTAPVAPPAPPPGAPSALPASQPATATPPTR